LRVSVAMLAAVPWISGTSDRIRIFKHEAVIHLAPFEQGEIGPDLFRHACLMGLEGLVSKHRDSSIALVGSTLDQGEESAESGDGASYRLRPPYGGNELNKRSGNSWRRFTSCSSAVALT
jgi:hypothetical protein